MAQGVICFVLSLFLGLKADARILLSLLTMLAPAILFISIGLLLGSVVSDKAVGGIASVLVNVAAWLGNIWFDPALVGGTFRDICYLLPFARAVEAARAALAGRYDEIMPNLFNLSMIQSLGVKIMPGMEFVADNYLCLLYTSRCV